LDAPVLLLSVALAKINPRFYRGKESFSKNKTSML